MDEVVRRLNEANALQVGGTAVRGLRCCGSRAVYSGRRRAMKSGCWPRSRRPPRALPTWAGRLTANAASREYKGRVYWETIPPGLLVDQIKAGGRITSGNMTWTAKADAYFAGLRAVKGLSDQGLPTGPSFNPRKR